MRFSVRVPVLSEQMAVAEPCTAQQQLCLGNSVPLDTGAAGAIIHNHVLGAGMGLI